MHSKRDLTKVYHIIFDAIDVDRKVLSNEQFIFDLLVEIPKLVGMRILSGPSLVRDYDTGHEGFTGFSILDFSHISIHTFVDTKEIYVDIFSCKNFDYPAVRKFLYKKLAVKPNKVATLEVKYPWE